MLGSVSSYTCPTSKSVCYSLNSPETHATLQDLQTQINRFASRAGFSTLAVDGLIGTGTVSAASKALTYAAANLPDGAVKATVISLKPFTVSRQILTPAADGIADALRQAAIALGLAPPSSGSGGGGGGGSAPYVPTPLPSGTVPFPGSAMPSAGIFNALTANQKALVGTAGVIGLGAVIVGLIVPAIKRRRSRKAG